MKKHHKSVCEFAASLIDKYWDELEDDTKVELTPVKEGEEYTGRNRIIRYDKRESLDRILKSLSDSIWVIYELVNWTACMSTDYLFYNNKHVKNNIWLLDGNYIKLNCTKDKATLMKKVVTKSYVEKITYKKIK